MKYQRCLRWCWWCEGSTEIDLDRRRRAGLLFLQCMTRLFYRQEHKESWSSIGGEISRRSALCSGTYCCLPALRAWSTDLFLLLFFTYIILLLKALASSSKSSFSREPFLASSLFFSLFLPLLLLTFNWIPGFIAISIHSPNPQIFWIYQ